MRAGQAGQTDEIDRRTVLQSAGATGLGGLGVGTVGWASAVSGAEFDGETDVRGSVEQVHVIATTPGVAVELQDSDGATVATGTTDEFGSYIFRDVTPETGYAVFKGGDLLAEDIEVLAFDDHPEQAFYDEQTLSEGYNYIETRDGTTLACNVEFPDEDGPYPVIIDYSGYTPSLSDWDGIGSIFTSVGYAVVGVNKRGSTCSGGAFDFVEHLQWLDGYDMVEAIAAQAWADGVGLAGKSYPGYMQLYVAATQPPSLDAIAPGHAVGDFYRDVGRPGGLYNLLFAAVWAGGRDADAEPGTSTGGRIGAGDAVCEANQLLRHQSVNLLAQLEELPFYEGIYEERSPWYFAEDIEVPTLFVVAWQDEQTTSRVARLIEQFDVETEVRLTGSNGDHFEYFDAPAVFEDIQQFFDYHLKGETPDVDPAVVPAGVPATYENADPVRIHWELDRSRQKRFTTSYAEWPPADVEGYELYFQPDLSLAETPPADGRTSTGYEYTSPNVVEQLIPRDPDDGSLIWRSREAGTDVAFLSDELETDRLCLGSAMVELWLSSTADDTDIQVTLSEVRPDGQEMFVQSGWLRASHRAESETLSKPRRPWHTHRADDQAFLGEEFERMRIELHPFGHVFREGSRIRVAIENPGGNRDRWAFELVSEEAQNKVAHSSDYASKIELPLVPDADAPEPTHPACGDVRSQPCRSVEIPIPPVVDGGSTPRDLDGDGLFEDINGDGEFTIADVQALFDNRNEDVVQQNAERFDFSGTGGDRVTIFDVQALFNRLPVND